MSRASSSDERELVVLVHGLWAKGWCMALLAWWLRRAGFDTRCFSYESISADLHENAVALHDYLETLPHPTVHLVGHSLGGIVIRSLFHYFPRQRPGRIVMLASPNRGSLAAQQLAQGAIGRALLGKCIKDLLAGVPRQWSPPPRDIGVISGNVGIGLGRLLLSLPSPNDGVVTVAETIWPASKAQLTLPVAHTGIIVSARVARAVASFLRAGVFD